MNFNFGSNPEYALNTTLTTEMINLYGVLTKFLVMEKIGTDDVVFGDHSHIKSDATKSYPIHMLPENTEDWDTSSVGFTSFGMVNFDNLVMFVSVSSFDGIPEVQIPHGIIGNLVIFPNDKVMEITDQEWTVPGINNLFTEKDVKSVLKLTMKPYEFKLINEVSSPDPTEPSEHYEGLDQYFQELVDEAQEQDEEAEVLPSVVTVDSSEALDEKVTRAIVDKTEDDVWGQF